MEKHLFPEAAAQEKFRNELKYVCSEGELQTILARIRHLCRLDAHVDEQGMYGIRSVYFDDVWDSCLKENENGNDPREKFRIRIYNAEDSHITLECKKKQRTMTHKESCRLTRQQYDRIVAGSYMPTNEDDPLLRRFAVQLYSRMLRPKVIVAYERTPFVYALGNVRITFDRNIGSTTKIDGFFDKALPLRPIMNAGEHVLEVKYDEFLPAQLYCVLNLGNLRQTTFSKYALCRKHTI
ncbi:MAG: polyphosphate polymerase domain-containing protein [Oscillospiraceae bacterium]|nr:polyphosphate polymerase domain-containing protein [Oscillospiraceae bacterium]